MKLVLVIHGSARRANTYRITELAKQEIASGGGVEFTDVFLHELKLPFCLGCINCVNKGENLCSHKEIIQTLAQQIEEADALILTSPTYILTLNAEVKNLLDHYAYLFHRPRYFRKKALVISSTAGAGAGSTCKFMSRTLQAWGMNKVHKLPIVCMDDVFHETPARLEKIRKASAAFRKDLLSEKLHHPTWFQLSLYTAMRSNATLGAGKQSADYLYWSEQKRLKTVYPTPAGIGRHLFARAVFALMNLMFRKL